MLRYWYMHTFLLCRFFGLSGVIVFFLLQLNGVSTEVFDGFSTFFRDGELASRFCDRKDFVLFFFPPTMLVDVSLPLPLRTLTFLDSIELCRFPPEYSEIKLLFIFVQNKLHHMIALLHYRVHLGPLQFKIGSLH